MPRGPNSPREDGTTRHRPLIQIKRDISAHLYALEISSDISIPSHAQCTRSSTYLDPVNDRPDVLRLKEELLALHAHADHVLPLNIVAGESALRVLHRVLAKEVLRVGDVLRLFLLLLVFAVSTGVRMQDVPTP